MTNLQKRNLALCLALALLLVATALLAAVGIATTPTVQAATTSSVDSYYANLNTDFTGEAFRIELQDLLTETHKKPYTTYDGLMNIYKNCDYDPDNRNNVILFYTGESRKLPSNFNSGVNREHVWPKSHGNFTTSNAGADGHHLMPCDYSLNSARGNDGYDDVDGKTGKIVEGTDNCYQGGGYFCPPDEYKGAVARILMYVQTRWGGTNNTLKFAEYAGDNTMGKISTLIKWHLENPPTEREIRRNNEVQKMQGNRNPFIDHPEYAAMIYGYKGGYFANDTAANKVAEVIKSHDGNTPTPVEKYVSYISIDGTATTRTYIDGEKFNPTGLEVQAVYSDGSIETINNSKCKWLDATTGLETLSEGTTAVVCRYENVDSKKIEGLTVAKSTEGAKFVTITVDSLPTKAAYNWLSWTANGISGKAYASTNSGSFQMNNNNKQYYYIFNETPLTGGIKTITMKGQKDWELRVNTQPYDENANKYPQTGVSLGTKNLNNGAATWNVDGNYEYFTLNYVGSGVTYTDEIVITYGATSGESGVTDSVKLDKLSARVKIGDTFKVGATASGTASYVSSDVNVATVDSQGNIKAIGKGVATITVTCGTAKAQFLVVVAEQGGTIDPDPTPTTSPDDQTDEYPPIGCFGVVSTGGICAMMFAVMAAFVATKKR